MAWKLMDRTAKHPQSTLGYLGSHVAHPLARGLERLGSYFVEPEEPTLESIKSGRIFPEHTPTLTAALESLGVQPKTPETFLQNLLQSVSEEAPTSAIFGLGALGRNVLGNVAQAGLKQAGAPDWLQTVGKLGTEIGAGALMRPKKLLSPKQYAEELFEKSKSNLPEVNMPSPLISKAIQTSEEGLKIGMPKYAHQDLKHLLKAAEDLTTGGTINLPLARKYWEELNNRIFDPSTYSTLKGYLIDLTESIRESFKEYAQNNPKFQPILSDLLGASDIWKNLKKPSKIYNYMEKLGKGWLTRKIPGWRHILQTLGKGGQGIELSIKSPAARKYYGELATAVAKDNVAATLNATKKLNKEIEKSPKGKWKLMT